MTTDLTRSQYIHQKMSENCKDYPVMPYRNQKEYNAKMQEIEVMRKQYSDEFDKLNHSNDFSMTDSFKQKFPLTTEEFIFKSQYYATFKDFYHSSDFQNVLFSLMKELPQEIYLQIIIQQNVKEFICEILNDEEKNARALLQINIERRLLKLYRTTLEDLFTELKQNIEAEKQNSLLS